MHYYGERCQPLHPPGSGCATETLLQRPPQPEAFANTCHPLSVTKSPVARWQSCPQPLTYLCPQPAASQVSVLPCQPLVHKCVVLCPEPCETTRLLPRREPGPRREGVPPPPQLGDSARGDKKRVARSLPPCAPRCPEPGRLRFPPCGIRSSASCRGECRPQRVATGSSRCAELRPLPGLTSGYSLPLRGVTECPPQQQSISQTFLQEYLVRVPSHRCTKGYPTQECVPACPSEQRLSPGDIPGKGTKECLVEKRVTKCSLPQEGTKGRSCSTHPSKSRCLHSPRSSRPLPAGAKRSGHSKRSRCASRWLW